MATPSRATGASSPRSPTPAWSRGWAAVAAVEATVGAMAVVLDLLIPSLVLVAMAAVSLAVRRQGVGSLGLTRFPGLGLVGKTLGLAALWSVFQLSVTLPIANHLSGKQQDLSAFDDMQGNLGLLAALVAASWVLGGLAEELGYRGYLLTRVREAFGNGRLGLVVAVLASSVLFGLAHTEQGLIGVLVVTLDGIWFSVLRLHYRTLWASVLAHGFNNTLGLVAFFLVGPIHGFW